jgi:hypothetical protein
MLKGSADPPGVGLIRGIAVYFGGSGTRPGRVPGISLKLRWRNEGIRDEGKVPEKESSSGMLPVRSGMQGLRRI